MLRRTYFKVLFITLISLGVIFIIGATGSLDLDKLSLVRYAAVIGVSALLISFGTFGLKLYKK